MEKSKNFSLNFKYVVVLAGIFLFSMLTFFLPESFARVTIDFDKIAANPTAPLTNEYADVGAIFENATVVHEGNCGNGAVSHPNALFDTEPYHITTVKFFMPGTTQPAVTDFISVYVGDWSGETDPIVVTAYDIQGNVVGTGSYTSRYTGLEPYGGDFGQITISAADIHRLEFTDLSPSGADYDDLCFNTLKPATNDAEIKAKDGVDFSTGSTLSNDPQMLALGGREVKTAVADGVTRLILSVNVSESGNADFWVDNVAAGSLSSLSNQSNTSTSISSIPSVSTSQGEKIFAVYKVPENFVSDSQNAYLSEREITVHVKFHPASGGETTAEQKIKLIRPPVVLIHGLWAGPDTWQGSLFEDFLTQNISNISIYDVDYSLSNGSYFYINLPKVADQIEAVIKNLRQYSNIAITQVDVVSHSMGGVLSRLFSQKAYYKKKDNFKEGYINKLITIDTPHYGAFTADAIAITRDNLSLPKREIMKQLFEGFIGPIDRGAIDDLRVTHLKITDPLQPCSIPSFTIVGDVTSQIGGDLANLTPPLNGIFLILNFFGVDTDFHLPEHDLIVEGNSQRGGFFGNTTETYTHIHVNFGVHPLLGIWGAVENPEVKEKVLFLLNSEINSGNFGNFN